MRLCKSAQSKKKSNKGFLGFGLVGIILAVAGYVLFSNYKNQAESQPQVLNIIRLPL